MQGDATVGWDFATTVDHRHLKHQLSSSLAVSAKNSQEHLTALRQYRTPVQNSAAVAEKVKAARSAAALQLAALEAKYGKDGAAEMQRIANMHPVGIKRKHKVMQLTLAHLMQPQAPLILPLCSHSAPAAVAKQHQQLADTTSRAQSMHNLSLDKYTDGAVCICRLPRMTFRQWQSLLTPKICQTQDF